MITRSNIVERFNVSCVARLNYLLKYILFTHIYKCVLMMTNVLPGQFGVFAILILFRSTVQISLIFLKLMITIDEGLSS